MHIAILWATWAVWLEIINCLYNLNIPFSKLTLLASPRSEWKILKTPFWEIKIQAVSEKSFKTVNFALFSAWWEISKKWAPMAKKEWTIVIDNSSAFRYEKEIPLIVPEINSSSINNSKIISNPNCTTIIASIVLRPLHKEFNIEKTIISTYQATSWAWNKWIQELLDNTKNYIDNNLNEFKSHVFQHPIAFNVIPHIDKFQSNWYTKEEMKVVKEIRKIFWDEKIKISCTAVRVPTIRAHSEAISIKTSRRINPEKVRNILREIKWIKIIDNIKKNEYPMPINASKKFDIEVGRIRQSLVFDEHWVDFFISWDQILKGAALNAVQILKEII